MSPDDVHETHLRRIPFSGPSRINKAQRRSRTHQNTPSRAAPGPPGAPITLCGFIQPEDNMESNAKLSSYKSKVVFFQDEVIILIKAQSAKKVMMLKKIQLNCHNITSYMMEMTCLKMWAVFRKKQHLLKRECKFITAANNDNL